MENLALVVRYFHLHLATAFVAMLAATAISCRLTGVIINDSWSIVIAVFATLVAIMPLLIFWQDKKRFDMREAALAIPWGLAFAGMLPLCVVAAARSHQPLQDSRFAHIDSFFGVNIPQVAGWAAHHALGNTINKTYNLSPTHATSTVCTRLGRSVERSQSLRHVERGCVRNRSSAFLFISCSWPLVRLQHPT